MEYVQLNKQILSIYINVKVNEDSLPRYYPQRYTPNRAMFEEVSLLEFELELLQGHIPLNLLQDLQSLNSYLIGKLGKMQKGSTDDPKANQLINYLQERYL